MVAIMHRQKKEVGLSRVCSLITTAIVAALVQMETAADKLPACSPEFFHFEFTECDAGGRWRVSVPQPNACVGGAPDPPTYIEGCSTSCESGKFYNLSSLECENCEAGHFSLGGGIMFDNWQTLPTGFHVTHELFIQSSFREFSANNKKKENVDCSKFGWQPRGDFIASQDGPCSSSLIYSVKLVKPGYLIYHYQYRDDTVLFQFQVQNDQCQSIEDAQQNRFPTMTEGTEWRKATVQLKTGLNVLHWKTIGMSTDHERRSNPVLIKAIEIYGVAYTSECTACPAGSFSEEGSKVCTECQDNHYSEKGAPACIPCANTEYSGRGAEKCQPRLPCTEKDFYETHTPCDEMKKMQALYKWIEPKICRNDTAKSVALPPAGKKLPCPPCNSGMHYINNSSCIFCPPNHFSDGRGPCKFCPPSTMPKYEYQFHTWNNLPDNMISTCMSLDDSCNSENGWQTAGDYIHSATNHADSVYMILSMKVPGFRTKGGIINGLPVEVGRVTFTFELHCSENCEFTFMQGRNSRGVSVVKTWNGTRAKQDFTHVINQNDTYTFTWAFQKVVWEQTSLSEASDSRNFVHDIAKIHSISVTNIVSGGAATCIPCHHGTKGDGCIPCPVGHYFDNNFTRCTQCEEDTYVSDYMAYGKESCHRCGPGLKSKDRQNCYSNCTLLINGKNYDFRMLIGHHAVKGSPLFTGSGTEYYHLFNITLCGENIASSTICRNNATSRVDLEEAENRVESILCRSTIVPPKVTNDVSLSTQSVSLGDHLLGITTATELGTIALPTDLFPSVQDSEMGRTLDINFFYTSPIPTQACPNGRSTSITLRCDTSQQGNGTISLPVSCSDGTCDGCNFHLLWQTRYACPLCTEEDFEVMKGECIGGRQMLHYITPKHCLLPSWVSLPNNKYNKCSLIPKELKIIGMVAATLGLFLLILLFYFWKKNRKLEYKYMKLVQSSSSKDSELPPAESCAIDDEDDDHFDSIQYKQSKSNMLLNKIRAMAGNKNENDNPFETVQLTQKDNYS